MNLRKKGQADSLELLLNTMCNTFGGIVMISLVMALLTRDVSPDAVAAARLQIRRAEISETQRALAEARQLNATVAPEAADAAAVTALASEIDELKRSAAENRAFAQTNAAPAAQTPNADASLVERLRVEESALNKEIASLTQQLERAKKSHQRELRLPRERATGKKPVYFILRYGRVYPISLFHDGQRAINTESIDWSQGADGRVATPVKEARADAVPPFARILREIPLQQYSIHFLVYDDSFPTFLTARQMPLQAGYDTGWEFLTTDKAVIFSAGGDAPPAL